MRLLTTEQAAEKLGLKKSSLQDRRYLATLGLSIIKVGRAARFLEEDVDALIARLVMESKREEHA
jgi:excisionase family DNA binding protein